MFIIEMHNYYKPYEDDTGFTTISSNLTASFDDPITDLIIDLPEELIGLELISIGEFVEKDDKKDYGPLLQTDQTKAF